MRFFITAVMCFCSIMTSLSQEELKGTINSIDSQNKFTPLVGATIFWLGTNIGTTSGIDGKFTIPFSQKSKKLFISFIGYQNDTLLINDETELTVNLIPIVHEFKKVEIVSEKPSIEIDYLGIENKSTINQKELLKAACCNLSESFETNPSIDVSFTDAITGTKQIEMLGLSGIYTQTTMENLPYIRGLISSTGLTFIPGTWINSINVSKGIGSVANGFESITGQIDVEMQIPINYQLKPFYFNLYGDNDKRFEGNLIHGLLFSEHLSVISMLHSSTRQHSSDNNSDGFNDMPEFKTYNLMQRWSFHTENGIEGQYGFQFIKDIKESGTLNHQNPGTHTYRYGANNEQFNVYAKTGYLFPEKTYRSFGLQLTYSSYLNNSFFGIRNYSGKQKTGYLNFIYQSIFDTEVNKFRTGFSFLFDNYDETFLNNNFKRVERIPGIFFEYTFKPDEMFSLVSGIRLDNHNYYGLMISPRLHIRYAIDEDFVLRFAAGRGFRTSNILAEYSSGFASSRDLIISQTESFGYGLKQESAWNFGFNATYYFLYQYREATFSIDVYRTQFENTTVADLDLNPQQINFYSLKNGAYSNSLQFELNILPIEKFSLRLAYRFLDVKQELNGEWRDKPFTSKNRMLLNMSYSTKQEDAEDDQMSYDLTIQWFGEKRIPSTKLNPVEFQRGDKSPGFFILNAQVSKTFNNWLDFYIGAENILNYKQTNPIISPENPYSKYFDASLIWGPISGRMIYSGIRLKV